MSGELRITGQMTFSKDRLSLDRSVRALAIDVAGSAYQAGVETVAAASAAALDTVADATTPGYAFFRNLTAPGGDHTHIDIGLDDSGLLPVMRLKPGEFSIVRLSPAAAIYAQAAGADGSLEVIVIED